MQQASKRQRRFVRALLGGATARATDGKDYAVAAGTTRATLARIDVADLVSAGVLSLSGKSCTATPEAAGWVRRQLLTASEPFAARHRDEIRKPDQVIINLAESPVARLATATASEPAFLQPHQVEAAERLRRLVERARLRPRLTMRYEAADTVGGGRPSAAADLGDMAADARRQLAEMFRALPADCANVVFDVCGLEKGLQLIEQERGWPRRSAKLVLRIGLEQLAHYFGLAASAHGRAKVDSRAWMADGARPPLFPET